MSVSEQDVRHIAELARLGLEPDRVRVIVQELNGILSHMEELRAVDTAGVDITPVAPAPNASLRPDVPRDVPNLDISAFAPQVADGFFLVPRLASHEQE
jgi:aspartyl-tRNA(Asn)/glutamyl-tRNA(Gln) amidotransferase subunit C